MQLNQHQVIYFNDLSISYGKKQCIDNFNSVLHFGSRIGIIGRNGCGKSSLIKVLAGTVEPSDGSIIIPYDVNIGYVEQLINTNDTLSGGERFNQSLSEALALQPNLLLLDEPTNHLDIKNRIALLSMLKRYSGTLIIVTHDIEVLRNVVDTIWDIANGEVIIFNGNYDDYLEFKKQKEQSLTQAIKNLNHQKIEAHQKLMKEQHRAKNSCIRGKKHIEQKKWATVKSVAKMSRSITTAVNNTARIEHNRQNVINDLQSLYVCEVVIPKFNLDAVSVGNKPVLNISSGGCSYGVKQVVSDINMSLNGVDRAIIHGNNASGKSTLIKAILGNTNIHITGEWSTPNNIGYIDQHYSQLDPDKTSIELISDLMPNHTHAEIRDHLNSFLLRKNEEVNLETKYLSGGEKVRLSLALIAAKPPKILLLDEITNNIDIETKEHLVEVLKNYPGAFILICHDNDFMDKLEIDKHYQISDGLFSLY